MPQSSARKARDMKNLPDGIDVSKADVIKADIFFGDVAKLKTVAYFFIVILERNQDEIIACVIGFFTENAGKESIAVQCFDKVKLGCAVCHGNCLIKFKTLYQFF